MPQLTQTQTISVVLNGESAAIPPDLTVAGLLAHLGIAVDRVAVELNRRIVRQPDWATTIVGVGAQIEIVHFVGGG